jgi:hypothetical protein
MGPHLDAGAVAGADVVEDAEEGDGVDDDQAAGVGKGLDVFALAVLTRERL